MKKVILLLCCFLFLLTGCFWEKDAVKFKKEYEKYNGEVSKSGKKYLDVNIDKKNIIKYATIEEINEIIKTGTGVIYFGYPECPWCRNAVPCLLEAASSTSLDKIYYLNMYDVRDVLSVDEEGKVVTDVEAKEGYKELLDNLSSILDDYIIRDKDGNEVNTGEKRLYVPTVVFILEGEIIDYYVDTLPSQTDPYISLTEEEKNELINIYKEKIVKVLDDTCTIEEKC